VVRRKRAQTSTTGVLRIALGHCSFALTRTDGPERARGLQGKLPGNIRSTSSISSSSSRAAAAAASSSKQQQQQQVLRSHATTTTTTTSAATSGAPAWGSPIRCTCTGDTLRCSTRSARRRAGRRCASAAANRGKSGGFSTSKHWGKPHLRPARRKRREESGVCSRETSS
jgi:hypothetical protein